MQIEFVKYNNTINVACTIPTRSTADYFNLDKNYSRNFKTNSKLYTSHTIVFIRFRIKNVKIVLKIIIM